ncbi:MAG: glycosyltransferase family 2 protein [Roseburia inulinivorans]
MKKPIVSVLIPVYNVEKYLKKCLESVTGQTLTNIEIICVNDGSTDNSLKILEKYKALDSRIKIVNKENGGLPSARNADLRYCNWGICRVRRFG